MKILVFFSLLLGLAHAQEPATPAGPTLTLAQYLEQVKSGSPEARVAVQAVEVARLRLDEAEVPFSPELYSEYKLFSDRREPLNAFSPSESKGRSWKAGVRDQTLYGLDVDAFFLSQRTTLTGVGAPFVPLTDYEQSQMGLNLKQSLWRNSFGESSRQGRLAQRSQSRAELLKQSFGLKNLLLRGQNTYWSLVSYNQIVRLQQENVDRARRLRDWMSQRASMRLFDDVDAMQAQASLETRELELQTSLDERAGLIRMFNTLRGQASDNLENLVDLPTAEFMVKTANDKSKHMSREDFQIVYEQSQASQSQANAAISKIYPQLDLVGSIASNGLDPQTTPAYSEAEAGRHPTWAVGVVFSIPLDYRLIGDMKRSYQAQRNSAKDLREQARFSEERAWDDLVKQNREAQGRFERASSLEKLSTELVKRERQRLLNGRTTTFQSIQIEQNLAAAQIARVRAQLALLQLHNLIQQFEEVL